MQTPLVLCWLEAATPSSAPGTHLRGTLLRLHESGLKADLVIANATRSNGRIGRTRQLAFLIFRGILAASRGTLLARWHPLIAPVVWAWRLRGGRVCLLVQGRFDDLYDSYPWARRLPGVRRFATSALRHADALAVPADGLRDDVVAATGRPRDSIALLPNGVDTKLFATAAASSPTPREKPYAVFVGNMAGWQGIDTILRARESSDWPDIDLVFIGDGADAHLVEAAVGPGVEWLGPLPQAEARPWMQAALVGLAPKKDVAATRRGISPFKIVEYAAAGIPVIASRLPEQAATVDTLGNGILIEPDDSDQLAQAVRRISENPELRTELALAGSLNAGLYDWRDKASDLKSLLSYASDTG